MAVAEFDPDKIKTEAFTDNPRLARVQRFCEENPAARISLVDAARVANLEASYFSSFFHEKTGVCFHSWLNYKRVLRAMHSLADTDLSITLVSRRVGFRDLRTFQRAFKRFASVTPTEYRKQARAEHAARAARTPVSATHRISRPAVNGNPQRGPTPNASLRSTAGLSAHAPHPANCGCGCHGRDPHHRGPRDGDRRTGNRERTLASGSNRRQEDVPA
jgi:AraC-like DNA-binding protein